MADLKDDDEDIAEELALGGAAGHGAAADEFLHAKTDLLRAQTRQIRIGHFREWLYASAEILLGAVILLIFFGIASAIWSAAHDNGLVIESFSVPPDLANRGLTGQVVASKLLDRLSAMQGQTGSSRAASSFANNWGGDIKVQIPDTGVSIGELNGYLRDWLGHETKISGDVYRTADGSIAVTVRVDNVPSPTFTGKDADLDKLMQQAAESVYGATQLYRYAVYLMNNQRLAEAQDAYTRLLANGSVVERSWAFIGLENLAQLRGDLGQAKKYLEQAISERPDFVMAYVNLAGLYGQLQHDEPELHAQQHAVALAHDNTEGDINPETFHRLILAAQASYAGDIGDFSGSAQYWSQIIEMPERNKTVEAAHQAIIGTYAAAHDGAAYRRAIASLLPTRDPNVALNRTANGAVGALLLSDPAPVLKGEDAFEAALHALGAPGEGAIIRQARPAVAYAEALQGDFVRADSLIAGAPADCESCARFRVQIATLEHKWSVADFWLKWLTATSPSMPVNWSLWGNMLLAKGDADGAIAKYKIAHDKGPRFADPVEGWGEALMAKNRADLALTKFAEANRYTPNWGRLHLKWGEALYWSGDKGGAKTQFALAAGLDLTPAEKKELSNAPH